jgi:hypothetical protein
MQTKVVLTEDNQRIFYDHYKRGHSRLVVIAHGFFNSKTAVLLKELGAEFQDQYDIVILDFRGHGQSAGLFCWTAKEYLDLIAVLEDVRKDYDKIGLIGFSLGAATSIITASKVDWLDSIVAVSAPTEFAKIEYHFWALDVENDILYNVIGKGRIGKGVRPGPFWLKKDKPIHCVSKVKAPVLFLHGESDWLIKASHSQKLYSRAVSRKNLVIIKNGPHAEYLIRKNKKETIKFMRDWLKETL